MMLAKIGILFLMMNTSTINIIEIRNLYEISANNKSANAKLIKLLSDVTTDNALLLGYKGAAIMTEANHVFNPFTKLSRFKKGKKMLEDAIKLSQNNIELRYLRLTIQTNIPSFLAYSTAIETDKQMLIKELDQLEEKDLKKRMINYLIQAKICDTDQLRKLNIWKKK